MTAPTLVQHKTLQGFDVLDATPTPGNRFVLCAATRAQVETATPSGWTKIAPADGKTFSGPPDAQGGNMFTKVVAIGDGKGGVNGSDGSVGPSTNGIAHLSEWSPCEVGDFSQLTAQLSLHVETDPLTPDLAAVLVAGMALGFFDASAPYISTEDAGTISLCNTFGYPGGNTPYLYVGYHVLDAAEAGTVGGDQSGVDLGHAGWAAIGLLLLGSAPAPIRGAIIT
jgi:hypothetical protein